MFDLDQAYSAIYALDKCTKINNGAKQVRFHYHEGSTAILNAQGNLWLSGCWSYSAYPEKLESSSSKNEMVLATIDNLSKALDKVSLLQRVGLWLLRK